MKAKKSGSKSKERGNRNSVPVPVGPTEIRSTVFLPEEILSKIFIHFVYDTKDNYVMDVLIRRIESIYQRLHTLLAVCTTWRRVGLACPTLWTVVPFADSQKGRQRPLSASLSLKRGGIKGLHLAISAWHFSPRRFKLLDGHWHRFSVINIWSNDEDEEDIHKTLALALKHSPSGSISTLSLRREPNVGDLIGRHYHLARHEPSISCLIGSLAVLRTSNINIEWLHITFTHRLVNLELTGMKLYDNSEIGAFFMALSSAKELKELKLVSFVIGLDQPGVAKPPAAITLPKLELLYLEHLYFNILQFVLSAIAPGSHTLTLNPLEETFLDYISGTQREQVSEDRVCDYLSSLKVHKLILWGGWQRRFFWSTKAGLIQLLKSVPSIKTLIMNYYPTNLDTLAALKRPSGSNSRKDGTFPVLTRLEMHGAYVEIPLSETKNVLDDVLGSHQIQHMVFGGVLMVDQRVPITKPLDEDDEMFEWLKHKVPHFTKSPEPSRAPEATDMWRLWDI